MTENLTATADTADTDIAIIGMACRLPGANDTEEYWQRICEGRELLTSLTNDELRALGIDEELLSDPNFKGVTSVVDGYGEFDAEFFGVTPHEARLMDPQHRLFLELCWLALEDSGYDPHRYPGAIGVYTGGGRHAYIRYLEQHFGPGDYLDGSIQGLQGDIGNYGDFMATRVSYKLGLRGPSIHVSTACSTALVSVHLACQGLLLGEADMALAGAANLHTPQLNGYMYEEGSICSPSGHLRPFDAGADGSVFGNGGGAVVLKRLVDAQRDGDRVIAVIKGTAINNDGSDKMTFTGPAVHGQADVVSRAHRAAAVAPSTIGYVETHGTGTVLGDPIEVAALVAAFGAADAADPYCALGTVKSQIGHLGPAAGIAGLIKAALVVERGQIPVCVNFTDLNPDITLDGTPFYIPKAARPWEGVRRAGVSAFGVGGTNAHAVLEQAPPRRPADSTAPVPVPLVLSARSHDALRQMHERLGAHLRAHPGLDIRDVAHTLAAGRRGMRYRTVVTADSTAAAIDRLGSPVVLPAVPAPESDLPVVFAFPGQGAQFVNAGRSLYDHDPVFRETIDRCAELLVGMTGLDVRTVLFPEPGGEEEAAVLLRQALWAQPSIFVSEYALARCLLAAGVRPAVMIGHSTGEYAAACLGGAMTESDALKLVAARGRLMHHDTEPGAMMAVGLPQDELLEILPDDLDIAACNAPDQNVVSGPVAAIHRFSDQLDDTTILHKVLGTSLAAHSSLMDPILDPFRDVAKSVELRGSTVPIASTLVGDLVDPALFADPEYWVSHLRQPVRFMDGAAAVLKQGPCLVVEVGAGRALAGMFRQIDGNMDAARLTPWVPGEPEPGSAAELTGLVWSLGGTVDWAGHFAGAPRERVGLPGYPFERTAFWLEPPAEVKPAVLPPLPKNTREATWLHRPRWVAAPLTPADPGTGAARRVLVLTPESGAGITAGLVRQGHHVVELSGPELADLDPAAVAAQHGSFDTVVHVSVPGATTTADPGARADHLLHQGFWPLIKLARATASTSPAPLDLLIVTADRFFVQDGDTVCSELGLLAGPATVLPQEYPHIRVVEADLAPTGNASVADMAPLLLAEFAGDLVGTRTVAYRNGARHVRHIEAVPKGRSATLWEESGTYLITGGLGGIGLALAEDAAATPGVRLVLTHRAPLPSQADAERLLADSGIPSDLRRRLEALSRIRATGAKVECVMADVTDAAVMREIRAQHGPFTGIVHSAGVPSGRLVDALDSGHVDRVLAPKVRGTLVLDEFVADSATEWMVLCSSLSSIVGGVGHVDYCSANAFLDSFAQWRTASGRRTVSLSFGEWTDVGMAVKEAARSISEHPRAIDHPLFTTEVVASGFTEYRGELRRHHDWVLDEHQVAGSALLPGTAIVEIFLAAGELRFGAGPLEIRELDLHRPVVAAAQAPLEFGIRVAATNGDVTATLSTRLAGGNWVRHASGRIGLASPAADPVSAPILAPVALPGDDADRQAITSSSVMTFGPRWHNVTRIARAGTAELIVECELPHQFHGDLERHALHPALLDTAMGSMVAFASDQPHLPMSYERITVHAPMPASVRSRITRVESADGSLVFDVEVQSLDGRLLLEVGGYTLRKVGAAPARSSRAAAASTVNRSLVASNGGDLADLRWSGTDRPAPGPGEVQVEVLATGLNFKEVLIASGLLDPNDPDHRFGLECAGVVRAVGTEVSSVHVGDQVMAIGISCFSDFVNVRAELTAPIPAGMTFEQAATVPVAFTTAYDGLVNLARLQRGERVLVHAATGGVGLAAVQLAHHLGAEVFATAGSDAKRDFARTVGATRVMDSRSGHFEAECLESGGVDVVLNSLSGDLIAAGVRTLRDRGRFIEIGRRDILAGTQLGMDLFTTGRTFSAYNPQYTTPVFVDAFRAVADLLHHGHIKPLPLQVFSCDHVSEAFTVMARAQHIGKVVVARPGADVRSTHRVKGPAGDADGITVATGVRAIRDALSLGLPHVIINPDAVTRSGDEQVIAGHVLTGSGDLSVHARPDLAYEYVPLEGDIEQRLGDIWATALSIDQIGREDRFLDLGGDSLYATQVVARVRKEFGVRIAPANILGETPLHAIASHIAEQSGSA